jgi:acetyl-CoA C-acetyltransferase
MPQDPRTPVLVGAAAVQQRCEDPRDAHEALDLMGIALERAADDAGCRALLARADAIRAARGFWSYADPCRALGERFGAQARTQIAEIGVLQTTLLGRAAADIAAGHADVVLVTGAEAKYRSLRAEIQGLPLQDADPGDATPDEVLRPHGDILSAAELEAGLAMPVQQYAVIENALRHAEGQPIAAHRDDVAGLWAAMSRVAAGNPDAWNRNVSTAEAIRDAGNGNRMLAFPYTKLHNSQWNVDQAAGLILCSLATARTLGISEDRLVFPLAVADANVMVPLSERRELQRCPGFFHAGERALARAGVEREEIAHRELYSCFPVAVRVQQRELGLDPAAATTVTGGMAFAGGPLNNFVLQALAKMVPMLRAERGAVGMLNAVSGILTKQGVSLWSTEARADFGFDDVSEATHADLHRVGVEPKADGSGTVASYTVLYDGPVPARAVAFVDLDNGSRTIAAGDAELAGEAVVSELCGARVRIASGVLSRA